MIPYKICSVVFYETQLTFFFLSFIHRIILNTRHFGEHKNVLPASVMIKEPSENTNVCVCGWVAEQTHAHHKLNVRGPQDVHGPQITNRWSPRAD